MPSVAAVVLASETPADTPVFDSLRRCASVCEVATVALPTALDSSKERGASTVGQVLLPTTRPQSVTAVVDALRWFGRTGATHLLWIRSPGIVVTDRGLKRLTDCGRDTRAAIVYSDYIEQSPEGHAHVHPLIDYQTGSLRDDFDFGHLFLLRGSALENALSQLEQDPVASEFGGWYDLRLRLSEQGNVIRLPEPTYALLHATTFVRDVEQQHFSYVDPRNRDYQIEMERIATAHLKRIGAFLEPPRGSLVEEQAPFAREASVVIPVKNRKQTVADAVASALSQEANFAFNVIVVDNHSDDGTTEILAEIARRDSRLVHLKPNRTDLGIGGCWNEAIYSAACGRFAVQLDSDDLYANDDVLSRVVATFRETHCAMVIGSYSIVDFDLNPIPPGLVDHREWTDENGHNNALRVAGLGAPRAFHVPTLRTVAFPNVSYGEDYAVGLRMTRSYRVGRIYDSLYCCRRWEDNTDHALSLEVSNRYATYKDRLRTIEIAARQAENQ